MAAAALQINTIGRGGLFANLSAVSITVTLTATVYATATGGIPIDLTGILQNAAPAGWNGPAGIQAINPADVLAILPNNMSTNGFIPSSIAIGTPTYTTPAGMSTTDTTANPGFLATCPATFRIWGTGASNAAHLAEVADGAVTDAFSFLLLINRNGANN